MKVKATIILGVEYELEADFPKDELFDMEKTYLENNFLDFIEDRVKEEYDIEVNAHIMEV